MNQTAARQRFEARFYRGNASAAQVADADNPWCERVCSCGAVHLGKRDAAESLCFDCSHARNPYAQKAIRMSVDATGEDSTVPARVAEGSHIFNVALPGVKEPTGVRDAYGQMKVKTRPVANNEVSSYRRLREMAKRANLTPLDRQARAIGGRS